MTRQEFIDDINYWGELINFCYDEGCAYCDDVYTEDGKNDYFNEELVEMARDANDWEDLLSQLKDIPTGYDYYISGDYGWQGATDDDFDDYKNDVLVWGDDRDIWDEDEEEVPDEEPAPYEESTSDASFVETLDALMGLFESTPDAICESSDEKDDDKASEDEAPFSKLCAAVAIVSK